MATWLCCSCSTESQRAGQLRGRTQSSVQKQESAVPAFSRYPSFPPPMCFPWCCCFIASFPPCTKQTALLYSTEFSASQQHFQYNFLFHFYSVPPALAAPHPMSLTGGPAEDCRRLRWGVYSCSSQTRAAKTAKDRGDPFHQRKIKQMIIRCLDATVQPTSSSLGRRCHFFFAVCPVML